MTLHLHDPAAPAGSRSSCASCRHFRREDMTDRRVAGTEAPDGHCGLRNPSKREGLTRWCRETDWCDQWQRTQGKAA